MYEYEYSDGDYSYTGTIVFLSDNTFSMSQSETTEGNTLSLIVCSGTYEGDPASDGKFTLKRTKELDIDESLEEDLSKPEKWKDIKQPELKELPADKQQEETMTVSGGGKKLSNEYTEFTRK